VESIVGIGTDIIEIARIEKAVQKNPRFASKILGSLEYELWLKRKNNLAFLAKRFAAKEAFAKALGIGFIAPISWQNVQILPDVLGKPNLEFSQELAQYIQQNNYKCLVSLSDEKLYAIAYVAIYKVIAM
jgi:holo-[acyl-carrier protein] synthase